MRRATLALVLLLLTAPPAAAFDRAATQRLARSLGSGTGLVVTDTRGRTIAAVRHTRRRPMGSLAKLYTAGAALLALREPPRTTVELAGSLQADGTLDGDVVLRGGGDALLGDPGLTALRDAVLAAGVRRITGRVVGDGSLFDPAVGGPATRGAYDPEFGGLVGALSFERGRAVPGGPLQQDPAAAAASRFDDLLEQAGVVLPRAPGAGARPAGRAVGSADGDLAAHLREALTASDAVVAEVLAKLVAVRRGGPGTSAGGAAAVQSVVRSSLRVRPLLRDAAGFVRGTQASPADVARLLRAMDRRPSFRAALARRGRGTLRGRSIPAGCRLKTGTLRSAKTTALAGICRGRAFAVISVGPSTARARRVHDRIARAVAR